MKQLKDILVSPTTSIRAAIEKINASALQIALVVNEQNELLGTVTDGDIRRCILKQGNFEANVDQIMRENPTTAYRSDSHECLLMKMHHLGISHLPIVDEKNKVVGLETLDSLLAKTTRDNEVIFMAGGMGKRLYPLTENCPKPLLKVGEKPIIEILLENFIKCGFKNFCFSINYKGEMIREYFSDGSQWGIHIRYIEEQGTLGTAGSLSLLKQKPDKPFFVINGDILTNVNFGHILDYHEKNVNQAYATLCVRQHKNVIPYGLVHIDEQNQGLLHIEEKPVQHYFANAGIYVLDPKALEYLSYNTYCDMPDFLTTLVKQQQHVAVFPIREYWLDIGHHENLIQAAVDYHEVF